MKFTKYVVKNSTKNGQRFYLFIFLLVYVQYLINKYTNFGKIPVEVEKTFFNLIYDIV